MKNDLAISVNGTQPFMGGEIPVVLGGFGPNARCICDKTAAEIHGMETKNVRARVTDNIRRFTDGVDYIDMKKVACLASNNYCAPDAQQLLADLGYTQMQISKAEHIYILSERGYAKLVKIMDTPLAWDIYEHLLDEYFLLREEKRERKKVQAPKRPALSSVNGAMKLTIDAMKSSGVAPEFIVLAVAKTYAPYGIVIPEDCLPEGEKLFECETIATELGIMSESGKPHKQAVSAIIGLVGVSEDEVKVVPFATGHYSNDTRKYKASVMQRIAQWLEEHGYPTAIRGLDGKTYKVKYKSPAA